MTAKKSNSFNKMIGGIASILIVAVILAAANIIAANLRIRKDMTDEKLYSLSDGTRAILAQMESDVTLKFFFNSSSPEVPVFIKEFANRVADLLTEYSIASNGRIKIEKYDPQPDSDEEEWAERYGVPGQQMGLAGQQLFMGLAAVSGDTEAVIPLIDPRTENLVEYNITRMIYGVCNPKKTRVGVISTLPVLGSQPAFMMPQGQMMQRAWVAFQEIQKDTELIEIPPDATSIPADISALILVHPKDLADLTLFAVDQFVMQGGNLLILMDPFSLTEMTSSPMMSMGQPNRPSELDVLLSAWGIKFSPDRLVADMASSARVSGADRRVEENPMWLILRRQNMNREDILTANLDTIMQPFAGTFTAEPSDQRTVTPLITTSPDSAMVRSSVAQLGVQAMKQEFRSEGKGLHTAMRVSGRFPTAFPYGVTIPAEEGTETEPKVLMPALKEGNSTIILVGDTDMFHDRFCVEPLNFLGFQGFQPINDNMNFMANAVEQLSGSPHLIGIRSRGRFERPFTRVLELEKKARKEWQAQEEELLRKLQSAQQRMNELQAQKDPQQRLILSPAQQQAITSFQAEEKEIRSKLKEVRRNLRREIDNLGLMIKILNIGAVPLLVGLSGIIYGLARRRRR